MMKQYNKKEYILCKGDRNMKQLITIFAAVLLLFAALPAESTSAAPSGKAYESYLEHLGWTETEMEAYLQGWDASLDEFKTLKELQEFLGEELTEESTAAFLEEFDMTRNELDERLAEDGLVLKDLKFTDDLYEYLPYDEEWEEEIWEDDFSEIGLTSAEIDALTAHFEKTAEQTEQFEEKLFSLLDDSSNFTEWMEELVWTEEQKQTFTSWWNELLSLLQISVSFAEETAGEKKDLSFNNLLDMESWTIDVLWIEIYDTEGTLLADLFINTAFIEEFGGMEALPALEEAASEQIIAAAPSGSAEKPSVSAEKEGGILPDTAGNSLFYVLAGLAAAVFGFLLLLSRKKMA